jgi:hypothetical protein
LVSSSRMRLIRKSMSVEIDAMSITPMWMDECVAGTR